MALYNFDHHDGTEVVIDDVGLEFPDFETVKVEAARGLADLARDVLPGSVRRELAIVVRDEQSRHVMKTFLIFEVQILNFGLRPYPETLQNAKVSGFRKA